MSLADHWDGGEYLPVGEFLVTVKSHKLIDKASTPGVEFTVADERGRQSRVTCWLSEKALWKLASFAKACGLTMAEAKAYNPDNQNSHRMLHGKRCMVEVAKRDDKYSEVIDFWKESSEPREPKPQPVQPVADAPMTGDDIPF